MRAPTDPVEEIARAGARLILQQSLEDEVTEFLGRGRYVRDGEPVGHRNGYEPRKVDRLADLREHPGARMRRRRAVTGAAPGRRAAEQVLAA